MIIFTKNDFRSLSKIAEINSQEENYEYTNNKNKSLADELSEKVKDKIKNAENIIRNSKYFGNNYQIGTCHRRKRGKGKYRNNLWLWLVYKKDYNSIKLIHKDTPQVFIPQLQVGISNEGIAFGEIWLEKNALRHFKEVFIKAIDNSGLNKSNLKLFVEFKDKSNTGKLAYTRKNYLQFKNLVLSENAEKAGIYYWIDKKDYKGQNISKYIFSSLIDIDKAVYSKLFKTKPIKYNSDYFKPRRRKPGRKENLKDYLRKGNKPTRVNPKHTKIQNDLLNLLRIQYKHPTEAKVDKEKDFIDIKVKGKKFEYLYEIKTSNNPVKCIREALGQLIYYIWSQNIPKNKDVKLFIIGMKNLPEGADKFFYFTKKLLSIEIIYDSIENLLPNHKY